jgi:YfiH family protein
VVSALEVGEHTEADAVYTSAESLGCAVVTADCLPVLLCDRAGSRVAAAHAGWRGLAAGILENTLDALGCEPVELLAWIGPAISQSRYEVGRDVLDAFLQDVPAALAGPTEACFQPRGDKFLADLSGLARLRLQQRGVDALYGGDLCTFSDPVRFHSWRRDGEAAGRLSSVIYLLPGLRQSRT